MSPVKSLSDDDLKGLIERAANPALRELLRRGYEIELTIKPMPAGSAECHAPLTVELHRLQDREV